ncbi:MAG: 50S ribosome-binding GTPase [Planctomycetota bacterium]|nr:50S ribosome-binding GTPase [Planctomycetota bacterium]
MDRLLLIEKSRKQARVGLEALRDSLARLSFLPRDPEESALTERLHHIRKLVTDNLIFRLGEGYVAPVIAVLAGGTGVGKSTLFNTLAGKKVSEISVKRPCTTAPLVYHHRDHSDALAGPSFLPGYARGQEKVDSDGKGVVLVPHSDDALHNVILIDSPDFDSVSDRNRDLSEDLLRLADLIVYVVNPEKYADDEVWRVIRKIGGMGHRTLFLFNRAHGEKDEAVQHFRELLLEAEIPAQVQVIFEWPDVASDGRISDPGSESRLRETLARLVVGDKEGQVRAEALHGAWEDVRTGLEKAILPAFRSDADLVRSLEKRMEKEWREAERRILKEVSLEQSADRQRASEVLRANLFDLVNLAERKIFGPVGMWIEKWTGSLRKRFASTEQGIRSSLDAGHEGNRAAIRRHLREATDRIRTFLEADPRGKAIIRSEDWSALQLPDEEIDRFYDAKFQTYETWLRDEFNALAKKAKSGKSAQLAVLQIVYLTLMVGGMAHTGGAITLVEGVVAGPILMALDRLFVKAIDWEVVEELQKKAREQFRTIFPELVAEQIQKGAELFESLEAKSAAAPEAAGILDQTENGIDPLVEALKGGQGK